MAKITPTDAQAVEHDAFVTVVMDMFMEGQVNGAPVKEIAARLGWSTGKTARVAQRIFDSESWTRVVHTTCYVPYYDKSYGAYLGDRACTGYAVTRDYLRDQIAAAKNGK